MEEELGLLFRAAQASVPNYHAVCVVLGGAHGYSGHHMVVHLQDASVWKAGWNMVDNAIGLHEPTQKTMDVAKELQLLRQEQVRLRMSGKNRNRDQNSKLEGRIVRLYIIVGTDTEWLECPGLLLNGRYANTALNRLLLHTTQLHKYVLLV